MRSRRALSTVIGTVFAIIALTSTVTYVSYSMGILDNYNQSVLTKNQQLSDVNKEKFQISSVTVPNGKLNITVVNTGSVPINFTKMWVQNTTTSATMDWVRSYVPTQKFVVPGGVLTNIGQSVNVIPTNSYNVKLVTSRGNVQQFTVNTVSSTKLNIQLYAFPSTIPSGFKSQAVLVITNNSTGALVNLIPTATVNPTTGNPTCTLGMINPPKADTLLPGGTVVFAWPVTISGANNDVCTVTVQLQNGQTLQIPITVTQVSLSSTTYAQNAGVITLSYTSFRWTQGNAWNNDWQFNHGNIAFSVQLTNNNQTSGGYNLWLDENSQLFFQIAGGNGAPTSFYIIKPNTLNLATFPAANSFTGYTPNSNQGIANLGGVGTVYFASAGPGSGANGGKVQALPSGTYTGFIVLYGKFTVNSGDTTGGRYAQTIPFMAVISS